jgi:hypothetical protein
MFLLVLTLGLKFCVVLLDTAVFLVSTLNLKDFPCKNVLSSRYLSGESFVFSYADIYIYIYRERERERETAACNQTLHQQLYLCF